MEESLPWDVEDLLHERGIEVSHETVWFWWNRFGPMFAAEIRRKRADRMRSLPHWRWHLDEVFVKISGLPHYLWRAVDHEGEDLEAFVSKKRDRKAALKFLKITLKRNGRPHTLVTDKLLSYGAALTLQSKDAGGAWKCGAPEYADDRKPLRSSRHKDQNRCNRGDGMRRYWSSCLGSYGFAAVQCPIPGPIAGEALASINDRRRFSCQSFGERRAAPRCRGGCR